MICFVHLPGTGGATTHPFHTPATERRARGASHSGHAKCSGILAPNPNLSSAVVPLLPILVCVCVCVCVCLIKQVMGAQASSRFKARDFGLSTPQSPLVTILVHWPPLWASNHACPASPFHPGSPSPFRGKLIPHSETTVGVPGPSQDSPPLHPFGKGKQQR